MALNATHLYVGTRKVDTLFAIRIHEEHFVPLLGVKSHRDGTLLIRMVVLDDPPQTKFGPEVQMTWFFALYFNLDAKWDLRTHFRRSHHCHLALARCLSHHLAERDIFFAAGIVKSKVRP